MAQDLRSIDANPIEGGVRESVPGQTEKVIDEHCWRPTTKRSPTHYSWRAQRFTVVDQTMKVQKAHQLSFCVKKYFIPAPRKSWGSAPVNPNESGSHPVSHRFPNRDSKYCWPNIIWRTSASPDGMLASCSTHEPPTGWNCPERTFSLTRAKSAG